MGWLLALFVRAALVLIWLTTPLVHIAFHHDWIMPLLGVIFVPFATLIYLLIVLADGDVAGWDWLWVALALLLDVGVHSVSTYNRRRRIPGYQ
jgi:hypothetical protein